MSKVTRIAYSKNLNKEKFNRLVHIASLLGKVRTTVWHQYGSLNGVNKTHRQVRDQWVAENKQFDVPARLWKETLRDTFDDISMYREAAKVKVRKAIFKRTNDKQEQKQLYTLLRQDRWIEDNYLRRMMRKHFKHGSTSVTNQIILDTDCYTGFERKGTAWIDVMSLIHGQRIAIPLSTNRVPFGTLRLIIKNDKVEIHYAIEEDDVCSTRPCGQNVVGVDKGYTDAFTDSDNVIHGDGLGKMLSTESDYLKVKYQRRNKLKSIAKLNPNKRSNIIKNNLGRKKLDSRKRKYTKNVRDKIFKAVHSLVDTAKVIVCEDLTKRIKSRKRYSKNQTRRLSAWTKGILKVALEDVSRRRRSTLELVNCAYTSQMDSRYNVLIGRRVGKKFYCFDGVVLNAELNSARNILARKDDHEIRLWTPYKKVRSILLKRTEQFKRLGLLNQNISCNL